MKNRNDLIVLILVSVSIIGVFFYFDVENSLLGTIATQFTPVNYDEVSPRNIVKNSVPVILLENDGNSCKMHAEKFFQITNHTYFVRSNELTNQLQYDHDERTLILPCDQISDEKSRLHVWYVVRESETHSTKFSYWVTPWTDNMSEN